tara:strand:+ start:847 stop:984 length:138 start_codon:yes stop_codon:yes gene_type:complete
METGLKNGKEIMLEMKKQRFELTVIEITKLKIGHSNVKKPLGPNY